jgi:UDPglucose--hexose-1-phosphate uridylyltransferase
MQAPEDPLFQQEPARGKCHVICFNPKHSLTLAELEVEQVVPIVKVWWVSKLRSSLRADAETNRQDVYRKVSRGHEWIKYVQM